MKTTILALAVMVFAPEAPVFAQNLVPNGSFEEHTSCPYSFGQWASVVGWTSPFSQSADYFNGCAGGIVCSVPYNNLGYQAPADGEAYMGLATYQSGGWYREDIAVQLTEPLQPGVPVYLSMRLSPGGFGSWDGASARYKAKGPDMRFFNTLPSPVSFYELTFTGQVALASQGVLGDTATWTTVAGQYVPDSAYSWLVIANFFPDSLSFPEEFDTVGILPAAYAFIDQVCVSYNPYYCAAWDGFPEGSKNSIQVRYQGEVAYVSMQNPMGYPGTVQLIDGSGRVVMSGRWPEGQNTLRIDLSPFPAGIFSLVCAPQRTVLAPLKLLHLTR